MCNVPNTRTFHVAEQAEALFSQLPASTNFRFFFMADVDMHEVLFKWPQVGPNTVVVTGTFDKWSSTQKLTKTETGFVGSVKIPWNQKILYKYVVDGKWALAHGSPVEVESRTGYVNHVYTSPSKPEEVTVVPASHTEPISDPIGQIVDGITETSDKNTDLPANTSKPDVTPIVADRPNGEPTNSVSLIVNDVHGELTHVIVGDTSITDAKSDSGSTAVADSTVLNPIPHTKLDEIPHNKNHPYEKIGMGKPPTLPKLPAKGEVFPSVSPPSTPSSSRFSSLRVNGKKKRTSSFFARIKEVFKSDKDKDKDKLNGETKN